MSECAFLNQGGGQVLFGVTQAGGRFTRGGECHIGRRWIRWR